MEFTETYNHRIRVRIRMSRKFTIFEFRFQIVDLIAL